jgi:hypothetical protein
MTTTEDIGLAGRFDLWAHLHRQRVFSLRTFGPGRRTKGVCNHIRKELVEIETVNDSDAELKQWIDVIILGFDGAMRSGASPSKIIQTLVAKQGTNEERTWPDWRTMSQDHAIEHDRSKDKVG